MKCCLPLRLNSSGVSNKCTPRWCMKSHYVTYYQHNLYMNAIMSNKHLNGYSTTCPENSSAPVIKILKRKQTKPQLLTLRPSAIVRIKELQKEYEHNNGNTPTLKVGVSRKGCSGNAYNLTWIDNPQEEKGAEIVEQDGVKIAIDPRALISIIGSEIEWTEDQLSSQFQFHNPNVKETCGCGLSFTIDEKNFE